MKKILGIAAAGILLLLAIVLLRSGPESKDRREVPSGPDTPVKDDKVVENKTEPKPDPSKTDTKPPRNGRDRFGRVRVRVRTGSQAPVPGASVRVEYLHKDGKLGASWSSPGSRDEPLTNDKGEAEIPGTLESPDKVVTIRVWAEKPGWVSGYAEIANPRKGQTGSVTITLSKAGVIEGHVSGLLPDTYKWVLVYVDSIEDPGSLTANKLVKPNEEGVFICNTVPPGEYRLRIISHDDFYKRVTRTIRTGSGRQEIPLTRNTELGVLRLRVSNAPADAPKYYNRVIACAADSGDRQNLYVSSSGPTIHGIPAGKYYLYLVTKTSHVAQASVVVASLDTHDVDLRIEEAGTIAGTVESAGPVEDATISWFVQLPEGPRVRLSHIMSDAKGRFTLPGVAPGRQLIQVTADGHADKLITVDVAAGKPSELRILLDRK